MVNIFFYNLFANNKENYYRIHYLCYLNYDPLYQNIYIDTHTSKGYVHITNTYKATNKRLRILKDLITICESTQW